MIAEVHLILRREGALLWSKRANTGYMDGYWSLVAGHVDAGEPFRRAMAREASEEAGLALDPGALRLVHTMHRLSDSERLSLFFEAQDWAGEPRNMEPEKCDGLGWYAPDALPVDAVPYVAHAVGMIERGVGYCEFGWD